MALYRGGDGNDSLAGGAGDDRVEGLLGDDTLSGGAGNDTLDGGAGFDLLDCSAASAAVVVDLAAGVASGGTGSERLLGIEGVLGSAWADTLLAGRLAAALAGGGGNDALGGGEMADTLDGGAGNDTLAGGAGNDLYIVQDGGDTIVEFDSLVPRLVSTGSAGQVLDGSSDGAALSADGRFVVFASDAADVAGGAEGGVQTVYLKSLVTGAVQAVASSASGSPAAAASDYGVLSADGRYVAFDSEAGNFVAGDTNAAYDVFVKDLQTGAIVRASVGTGGAQADSNSHSAALSGDGRTVVFNTTAASLGASDARPQLFAHDLDSGVLTAVSANGAGTLGNGVSEGASVDAAGNRVAFISTAGNLLAGGSASGWQVYVKDLGSGVVTLASAGAGGAQGDAGSHSAAISADGRWVAFSSDAANLVAGDDNGASDIFVKDLDSGTLQRVSTSASGAQASGGSADPHLSGDGRWLVFTSGAADLVAGDHNGVADVFVKDLQTQAIARVSVDADGSQAGSASAALGISADGLQIVYRTAAALAAGDDNGLTDIVGVVNPLLASGGGIDSVQASVSTTLPAYVENLLLTGSAAIAGTGNGLTNRITGNAADNRLDGGTGADTLSGGAGNDSYVVQNGADVIVELAGGGTDSVSTSVSYRLPAEVEHLLLTGSNNSTLTGNSGANRISGNGGNNVLDGGSNADTLTGGAGNDSYKVQNSGDVVVELAGGGTDSVSASIGYTLPAEIEKLVLTGSGDGHASGNALHNTIIGNSGDNKLRGSTGNDTLTGGAGADTFRFSSALSSSNNVDTVTDFDPADDRLELENTVFTKLAATGVLSASNFRASTSGAAGDGNDFVLYETDTGKLYYDADGSGPGASVPIATFSHLPVLTAGDIFVT